MPQPGPTRQRHKIATPPGAGRLRVVSGGQTGVDRAALDAALALALETGGWCPRGRWAEDGPIPARYPLRETPSADPAERTRLNVRDADATLVVCPGEPVGGTALTVAEADRRGRPALVVAPSPETVDAAVRWIGRAVPPGGTLNVAGPRESEAPGIGASARTWLAWVLQTVMEQSGRAP